MREGQIHPEALMLAEQIMAKQLPITGGRPFMTYAKPDEFTGQPAYGLQEVLDATFRVAPEGVHGALTAAQEIDTDRKAKEALKHIGIAAGSAAAAAASPIPFSDATLLVPIQLGMMARIAQLYKIKFDRAALMAIASTTAATQVGRAAFTGLLKLVPGRGHGGRRGDRGRRGEHLHVRHGAGLAAGLPAGGRRPAHRSRRRYRQRAASRGLHRGVQERGSSSGTRKPRPRLMLRCVPSTQWALEAPCAKALRCPLMTTPDVADLLDGEPVHDQVVFETRLPRYWPDLLAGLTGAYPDHAVEMAEPAAWRSRRRSFRQRPRTCGCSTCAGTPTRSGTSIRG